MSTRMKPNQPHEGGFDWLHQFHIQAILALLLVALGIVFFLLNTNVLSDNSNWWVIFLAIPGLGLLWTALTSYQEHQRAGAMETSEVVVGVLLLLLTVIFIFDPTWTFLNFGQVFPNVNWDKVWPFALIVPGVVGLVLGGVRRSAGLLTFGVLLTVLGGIFFFNINWNYAWPFALIIAGLLLFFGRRVA